MYKPVKFITEVPYLESSTFYLFSKSLKILLPIEIDNNDVQSSTTPTIYNSIKRIIEGIGAKVLHIKIYHHYENTFYTYLTIKNDKEVFEINISFKDGIEIAKEINVPIYVKSRILENHGIKITKDLITKALKN